MIREWGDGCVVSTNSPAQWTHPASPIIPWTTRKPQPQEAPTDCFPKDRLTVSDLLPETRQTNKGQANRRPGRCSDQNFLTAGHHAGIDTIGSTLKIANLDLRSIPEPASRT
jgi:hypothetical protein